MKKIGLLIILLVIIFTLVGCSKVKYWSEQELTIEHVSNDCDITYTLITKVKTSWYNKSATSSIIAQIKDSNITEHDLSLVKKKHRKSAEYIIEKYRKSFKEK